MTDITVTTTELDIVEDVQDALEAAQISSVDVFAATAVILSDKQAKGREFTDSPIAIVRYENTVEHHLPDERKGGIAKLVLMLAAMVDPGVDAITEALRLKNAAVNAIHATPPADAEGFGDMDGTIYRRLQFGEHEIDSTSNPPWVICNQPLAVAFIIAGETQH